MLIGHRGFRAQYPENTLVSFQAAADAGVQMVELEVHLTRDNELVVIHDGHVDRTTNGTGPVDGHTLAALKKLDAGGWLGPQFENEPIPTLKEVLRHLCGRVLINIEIKSAGKKNRHQPGQIEDALLDLIERENAFPHVLISSFDPEAIEAISQRNGSVPVALISESANGMETVRFCQQLNVFSFHPNYRCLTPDLMTLLHDADIQVFPYTVNTEPDFKRMIQMKVDGIITDDPILFKTWYAGFSDDSN
jgi:glycerophosphoryl diester phosphodiesterase